jgi:hypothetical protein
MKTPHKHAEVLRAIADGKEVECRYGPTGSWCAYLDQSRLFSPLFCDEMYEWRIKPEPKPDVVQAAFAKQVPGGFTFTWVTMGFESANVKFTFDGENGKLKSAEVLKLNHAMAIKPIKSAKCAQGQPDAA